MTKDLMQYERLTREALCGVVRKSLERVARGGLPGAHHFYITFRTTDPGCSVDASLASIYSKEMTIVLEHQFWDLSVDDEGFEVTLKFDSVPKYLRVPWCSVIRFHDPSVGFHLHFDYLQSAPHSASSKESKIQARDEGTVVNLASFRKKAN